MQSGAVFPTALALMAVLSAVSVSAEPMQALVLTDPRVSAMPPGGYEIYANGYVRFRGCPETATFKLVDKAAYEDCDVNFPSTYTNEAICHGDEVHLAVPQETSGRHPWASHAHKGIPPNTTVYFIATKKGQCDRGFKFFVNVLQNPECFATCCPNAADVCFFRDGAEGIQNCELNRVAYPQKGMTCDDGNAETSGETCTQRGVCLGHRSITAFFLQSELSNFTDSLTLTIMGQEAIAAAVKQSIGASQDVSLASATFNSDNVEVTLEVPDENVGLAELQSRLFNGSITLAGGPAVTISSSQIVLTTTAPTSTTGPSATGGVTVGGNGSAATTAQPGSTGNPSEAGRSAGFRWSTTETGITIGAVCGVVIIAGAIILFVKYAGPGKMQPRVSSADTTTSSSLGAVGNTYDYSSSMTPNPVFNGGGTTDADIVTKLSISLPTDSDSHVYDSVA